MTEQLDMFSELDRPEHDRRRARETAYMQEAYRRWLVTPELTPITAEPDWRKWEGAIYNVSPEHRCEEMPDDVKIWQNTTCTNYWVLNHMGKVQGERVLICPFCGKEPGADENKIFMRRWYRGETYYQERSVRDYYRLDEVDNEPDH